MLFLLKMKPARTCLPPPCSIGRFASMFTESCLAWQKAERKLRDLLLERTDFHQNVCTVTSAVCFPQYLVTSCAFSKASPGPVELTLLGAVERRGFPGGGGLRKGREPPERRVHPGRGPGASLHHASGGGGGTGCGSTHRPWPALGVRASHAPVCVGGGRAEDTESEEGPSQMRQIQGWGVVCCLTGDTRPLSRFLSVFRPGWGGVGSSRGHGEAGGCGGFR